jgi:hypothetical protein
MGALAGKHKDYLGGALMIAIGVSAIFLGKTYSVGSLSSMGPGFFPVAIGCVLALSGVAIAAPAWFARPETRGEARGAEWRGWFCIVASLIAFVVLGRYGGLVPATIAIVFISALGDRQNTLKSTLILTALMLAMCLVVFWWALQVQFPLFAWGGS